MQKPHVHAKLIKAWADGAEIECRIHDSEWIYTAYPVWYPDREYRIKQEPKSLGQVAFEAYFKTIDKFVLQQYVDQQWEKDGIDKWREAWEAAAQAAIKEAKERE